MSMNVVGFFCEDIRQEKTEQLTLVGVLPDRVKVPPLPPDAPAEAVARMPKLALYARIQFEPSDRVQSMTTKLRFPDGSVVELGRVDDETIAKAKREAIANDLPIAGIVQQAILQGLTIPRPPALITGLVEVDGKELTIAVLRFVEEA
jgi:hypothetical protein